MVVSSSKQTQDPRTGSTCRQGAGAIWPGAGHGKQMRVAWEGPFAYTRC